MEVYLLNHALVPRGNKNHADDAIYISAKLYTHEKNYEWKTKTVKGHNGVSSSLECSESVDHE